MIKNFIKRDVMIKDKKIFYIIIAFLIGVVIYDIYLKVTKSNSVTPTETFHVFKNPKYTLVREDKLLKLWKVTDLENTRYVAEFIGHPDADLLNKIQTAQVGNLSLLIKGNNKFDFDDTISWNMARLSLIFYDINLSK